MDKGPLKKRFIDYYGSTSEDEPQAKTSCQEFLPSISGDGSSQSETPNSHSDDDSSSSSSDLDVSTDRSFDRTLKTSSTNYAPPTVMEGGGFAAKMMAKMGYEAGTGLGKHGQGRVEPVEASKQKGRRGLGMQPSNFERDDAIDWENEEVSLHESIDWLPEPKDDLPSYETLKSYWIKIGKKTLTIDNETEFVDEAILKSILTCKNVFDELEGLEMRKARTRSNPFELIKGGFFQNRAAMKMANMDAMFDFMFTKPKDDQGKELIDSRANKELLYFSDICAGPGGFSEYVLWRLKWRCKGFGLTLKSGPGVNDFKLEEFITCPVECFEPHYGVGGAEGDGDIYRQDNIDEFSKFIMNSTDQKGVHFVMADGGFSVEGQENVQEILSKRLYLCQFLCALSILRNGGHFTCKLFDMFTPFSIGLVYLMRYAFVRVCICKPVTSRPANSERYIVCEGFQSEPGSQLRDYFTHINRTMDVLKFGSTQQKQCIQEIVPLDIMKDDADFFEYMYNSNTTLGRDQCTHLRKIQIFAKNPNLNDKRQMDIRDQCLQIWKVPDEKRTPIGPPNVEACLRELIGSESLPQLENKTSDWNTVKHDVKSIYDYRLQVSGMSSPNEKSYLFYVLSLGKGVYMLDQPLKKWIKLDDGVSSQMLVELPRKTLLICDCVAEYSFSVKTTGEKGGQIRKPALHIADVLFINGEDFRKHSFNLRMSAAKLLIKAINRPTRRLSTLRVKPQIKLDDIDRFFRAQFCFRKTKNYGSMPRLIYLVDSENIDDSPWIVISSVTVIPFIHKPWTLQYSRSSQRLYYYNLHSRQSSHETPKDVSFSTSENALQQSYTVPMTTCQQTLELINLQNDLMDWVKSLHPHLR